MTTPSTPTKLGLLAPAGIGELERATHCGPASRLVLFARGETVAVQQRIATSAAAIGINTELRTITRNARSINEIDVLVAPFGALTKASGWDVAAVRASAPVVVDAGYLRAPFLAPYAEIDEVYGFFHDAPIIVRRLSSLDRWRTSGFNRVEFEEPPISRVWFDHEWRGGEEILVISPVAVASITIERAQAPRRPPVVAIDPAAQDIDLTAFAHRISNAACVICVDDGGADAQGGGLRAAAYAAAQGCPVAVVAGRLADRDCLSADAAHVVDNFEDALSFADRIAADHEFARERSQSARTLAQQRFTSSSLFCSLLEESIKAYSGGTHDHKRKRVVKSAFSRLEIE
jgi:hypothetical protein